MADGSPSMAQLAAYLDDINRWLFRHATYEVEGKAAALNRVESALGR
jgi:hypothetical protein